MFCLRSWLPLLFIPTNASPLFVLSFFALTYFLNRPCVYCSILLLILFASSCYWSTHCFFDVHSNWFEPRHLSSAFPLPGGHVGRSSYSDGERCSKGSLNSEGESIAGFLVGAMNTTAAALAGAAFEEAKKRVGGSVNDDSSGGDWTGIGLEWVRSLLGRREWTIPCVDVSIRL